ncbi:MAG: amino acid adenylation domain-containing protein [Burkholderiaceae bacterium]
MDSTQCLDEEATLPLSPEQLAIVAAAGGALAGPRTYLLEIDRPVDVARFASAIDRVLQGHELLRYRPARVEGFRLPRLQREEGRVRVVAAPQALSVRSDEDIVAAANAWLGRVTADSVCSDGGTIVHAVAVLPADGVRRLLLAFDPLLFDEGSVRQLIRQALDHYDGWKRSDVGFHYPQYIDWRHALDSAESAPEGREYWRGYVALDAEAAAPTLSYRLEEEGATHRTIRATSLASAAQMEQLRVLAQQQETSVEVVLQALWWLLLARLTAARRFVGGWRHDCRNDYAVMANAVGVFEKTLPVLIEVRHGETLVQWLARFADTARSHVDQQEYWPLVDAPIDAHQAVGFVAAPGLESGFPDAWRLHVLLDVSAGFELALHVAPADRGLEFVVAADAGRYPAAGIERLSQQFSTLLASALKDPDQRVEDLDVVGDEERAALLSLNPSPREFGGSGILQRIARRAHDTPDAPALVEADRQISYRDLAEQVCRRARWLKDLGVKPGGLVALMLPRSMDLVTTLLGVWQAGAGYLPIEPDWPEARRQAVLEDARPAVVVHESLPARCNEGSWRNVALDDVVGSELSDDAIDEAGPVGHDIAYVLYTSGSTGKPKGVVIEHAQLRNYVEAVTDALELATSRRWALVSTVAADLGNTALFGALFNGACLVVARPEDVADGQAFARFLAAQRIDALKIVPSHLDALLEGEPARLPATIVLGGEAAPRKLLERIRAVSPHTTVHNHYGPTETTVGVMVHTLGAGARIPAVVPLTRVLANNRVYVLDDTLRLVPTGARGEIYVGGAQVCRGYLNRDAAADFVADPFVPGQRLYRTRDLAWVLPGGGIGHAGRSDEQLKIRGFRVSPLEVEAALLAQPGIRQAVVLPMGSEPVATELVAFVVGDAQADPSTLRAALQAQLPAHMVPARITVVDALPRLANGKVDRLTLRGRTSGPDRHADAPVDPLELGIARSMAELLEREAVGPDEDFFDLGAHSLMVIKLVARLRKQLAVEIAPALVFDHSTPASLASALREELIRASESAMPAGALN